MRPDYAYLRSLVGFASLMCLTSCQPSQAPSGDGTSAEPRPALSAPRFDASIGSSDVSWPLGWSVVNLPSQTSLFALWGAGQQDVWAGGKDGLFLHWDGRSWSTVPSPTSYCVRGLGGTSSRDIWAITTNLCPSTYHVSFSTESEILHWDGARWSTVATHRGELTAVAASASDEAWITGIYDSHGIILRWDGTQWQDDPKLLSNVPMSLSVQSRDDVWLAAWYTLGSSPGTTKLQHWDGTGWQSVSYSANPTLAVWGSGARDVWTSGEGAAFSHWDGATWTRVAQFGLLGVADLYMYAGWSSSPDNAWAAGDKIMAHWDGRSWDVTQVNPLYSAFAMWGSGSGDIWLVGQRGMAHYCAP